MDGMHVLYQSNIPVYNLSELQDIDDLIVEECEESAQPHVEFNDIGPGARLVGLSNGTVHDILGHERRELFHQRCSRTCVLRMHSSVSNKMPTSQATTYQRY